MLHEELDFGSQKFADLVRKLVGCTQTGKTVNMLPTSVEKQEAILLFWLAQFVSFTSVAGLIVLESLRCSFRS